jgi:exonuclease III
MNLKILTWNVRGLNDRAKRLCIKNMIKDWHADIICLQETKMEFNHGSSSLESLEMQICRLDVPRVLRCVRGYSVDVG